jgi:hypothetical protein
MRISDTVATDPRLPLEFVRTLGIANYWRCDYGCEERLSAFQGWDSLRFALGDDIADLVARRNCASD